MRVNMSQQPRDLFIRSDVKTTHTFHIKDETQGWVARDGITLAYVDFIAEKLPCDTTLPQHHRPGQANETIRENLPG
jgi:hypothetical protein